MSDFDDLLDTTLDDLEDLPEFKPFPAGAHRAIATMSQKEVNAHPCVELSMKYVEAIQIPDDTPEDKLVKEGDSASMLFMLDSEFGRGKLKAVAKPFQEAMGFTTIRDVVEGVQEVEVAVVTTLRKDKNDPDREFMQIKELEIL